MGSCLEDVAAALNSCLDEGLKMRLRHGAVLTSAGYVLPVGPGKRYMAVTVPLGPVNGADLDEILRDD